MARSSSYEFPPRRRSGANIEEKWGLVVDEKVINSDELLLLDRRRQELHRATRGCVMIFTETATEDAEGYALDVPVEIFTNAEEFQIAMALPYEPTVEAAMLWKYEQELPVYKKFEPLLAAARAKGPDPQ
jgi:hypothetical protein